MGITLQKTAFSVNIKERFDFSCAVLTAEGDLLVNAPHIPVHLGAMSICVKLLITSQGTTISKGDIFLTNDPSLGGSHIPDLTVITPIFYEADNKTILFYVASRAHHAEIGGKFPGGANPFATSIAEEGIVFRHFKVVEQDVFQGEKLNDILTKGEYPSRQPDENVLDINS